MIDLATYRGIRLLNVVRYAVLTLMVLSMLLAWAGSAWWLAATVVLYFTANGAWWVHAKAKVELYLRTRAMIKFYAYGLIKRDVQ